MITVSANIVSTNIVSSFWIDRHTLSKIESVVNEHLAAWIMDEIESTLELQNFNIWEAIRDEIVDR